MIYAFALFLLAVLGLLLWRDHGPGRRRAGRDESGLDRLRRSWRRPQILVDGSNVMWWDGNTPRVETLIAVTRALVAQGFRPRVIFDATAGYKLWDRYRHDAYIAKALGLAQDQVTVVQKGEVADLVLLQAARRAQAAIVTNDRYREWLAQFPEAAKPGRLVRGGYRDGRLWLDPLPGPAQEAA